MRLLNLDKSVVVILRNESGHERAMDVTIVHQRLQGRCRRIRSATKRRGGRRGKRRLNVSRKVQVASETERMSFSREVK